MRFVIITGLSGSGKSNALKVMEDIGFFCVDNLPPVLLPKLAELCFAQGNTIDKVAVVMDIRGRDFFPGVQDALRYMDEHTFRFEVLFLFASEEELINRYNFTRRSHPLATGGRIVEGIRKEMELLSDLKARATHTIDTTNLKPRRLGEMIRMYYGGTQEEKIRVSVISFGFKRGIPADTDMVFDARFLPNPYNEDSLRRFSGKEKMVSDYLFQFPETTMFAEKILDMVMFMLPLYAKSTKRDLVVAIGCTGGMHRSVALAEWLNARLLEEGEPVYLEHRDMENEKIGVKYTPADV